MECLDHMPLTMLCRQDPSVGGNSRPGPIAAEDDAKEVVQGRIDIELAAEVLQYGLWTLE